MVRNLLWVMAAAVGLYVALAYVLLPALWTHYEHQKKLAGLPMLTTTTQGIPGDPINIGLIGTEAELRCAMIAAGWTEARALSLRSDIGIAASVLLDRPDKNAPVSTLLLNGRREDIAFEKADGRSADRRHHVRFWLVLSEGAENRPVWLGSGTFDVSVGVSRYTGAITHHIAPDIDAERERDFRRLAKGPDGDGDVSDQRHRPDGGGPQRRRRSLFHRRRNCDAAPHSGLRQTSGTGRGARQSAGDRYQGRDLEKCRQSGWQPASNGPASP